MPAHSLRLMLVCLVTCGASQFATAGDEPISLNWLPKAATSTNYCAGSYLPFTPKNLDQSIPLNQQPINIDADSSEYTQGITRLEGNVEMRKGDLEITSDTVLIDSNQNTIDIEGDVTFYSPDIFIESDDAHFNLANSEAKLNQTQLALPSSELRASSEVIDYHADNTVTITNGSFTFCPPGDNTWAIHSNNIELDPNTGFGEANNAILKIGQVPVFYLPWMRFPINNQRKSGFLFPTLQRSSRRGLDVTTPYYLNLAPNYDALITPRFTELRDNSIGGNFRHLGQNSEQTLDTQWVVNAPQSDPSRWLIEYNQSADLTHTLSSSMHIKRVSDSELFDDYGFAQIADESTSIISNAKINYQGPSPLLNTASIAVIGHQNLNADIPAYDQLPHATLSGGKEINQQQVNAAYTVDLSRFTRDTQGLTDSNKITGTRTHLVPNVSRSWATDYSFLRPKISLPITNYQLNDEPLTISDHITRAIPQIEIDSGLMFERPLSSGYTQTLEPRLYYAYAPYQQQDDVAKFDTSTISKPLYQPNRFSGYDRIADTNRITLGLDSQFLNAKGWQKAKLSMTQIHYLSDRKVQLSSTSSPNTETFSPIYGLMEYQFTPHWSSGLAIDWSPKSGNIEATSANMKYQINTNKIIDVKYIETLNDTQQGEVSLIWPIAPQWTFIAKHKEDIRNQQLQDEILGVEYANCCWKGRLASRRWLVDETIGIEHGIFFELSLKGLGQSDKQLTDGTQVRMADFMKGVTGYNEYTQ